MTDIPTEAELAELTKLQLAFSSYEIGMCERGSGCTEDQRIGAAVALSFVESHVLPRIIAAAREALRLRDENEQLRKALEPCE